MIMTEDGLGSMKKHDYDKEDGIGQQGSLYIISYYIPLMGKAVKSPLSSDLLWTDAGFSGLDKKCSRLDSGDNSYKKTKVNLCMEEWAIKPLQNKQ